MPLAFKCPSSRSGHITSVDESDIYFSTRATDMDIAELLVDQEITLKQISLEFAEELFNLVQKNFEEPLCYWCPDLKKTYASLESTIAHIKDAQSKYLEDGTPDFLIFSGKNIAGLISLSPLDELKIKSEIGYWLGSEFEGKGLIVRSFPVILEYAKNNLKLKTVELSTSVPNIHSQKLPLMFGFKKAKIIPDAERLADGIVDHILWRYDFQ